MDLTNFNNNLEQWFLARQQSDFPDQYPYVANYKAMAFQLVKIQEEVNAGADFIDGQTLTRHDNTHIQKVIKQVSKLLTATNANISSYEAFILLLAIQIHDIKNAEGRDDHEIKAIDIFNETGLNNLFNDSITIKLIGKIASCHAGSFYRGGTKEKDKIGFLLAPTHRTGEFLIRPQYLAALLRLADEYADEPGRAYTYLLKKRLIKKKSEIHHKYAESLQNISIEHNGATVKFEYYIDPGDTIVRFGKHNKETDGLDKVYLLDEIFVRSVKSHYETVYCMRFLRPEIVLNQISVYIELVSDDMTTEDLIIKYSLAEKGYPYDEYNIIQLCGDQIKNNGGYWTGDALKKYVKSHNLVK